MKIMVLADSRSFHTGRYVRELRRQGCRVLLVSLEKGTELQFTLKRRGVFRAFDYAAAAVEIRALVKRFRPDIINPHFASGYGFAAAVAGVRSLAPVLLHLWGSDILIVPKKSFLHRWKTRYALSRADCILGDSDFVLGEAERLAALKRKQKIYWGIEKDLLELSRSERSVSRPLKVIVPRPHEDVYNNRFLLRALAPLINDEKIQVVFPDFGGKVQLFHLEAESLCSGRVKFYAKLPRKDFLAFLAGHDVYLSGAVSDSSPVSLLEAMGLGLIPIAADIPGVREWLNADSGFTFDLNSADSLRRVMVRVIDSGDSLRPMRERNIARVRKEAVFEDNLAATINIMRELAGKGSA